MYMNPKDLKKKKCPKKPELSMRTILKYKCS